MASSHWWIRAAVRFSRQTRAHLHRCLQRRDARLKKCSAAFRLRCIRARVEVLIIDDSSSGRDFSSKGLRFQQSTSAFQDHRASDAGEPGLRRQPKARLSLRHRSTASISSPRCMATATVCAGKTAGFACSAGCATKPMPIFGSRMIDKTAARTGGMPSLQMDRQPDPDRFQNWMLQTNLSEFHSGYRSMPPTRSLQLPFECNSGAFHFDTEIIIQLVLKKFRILELPIPTFTATKSVTSTDCNTPSMFVKTMVPGTAASNEFVFRSQVRCRAAGEKPTTSSSGSPLPTMAIDAAAASLTCWMSAADAGMSGTRSW